MKVDWSRSRASCAGGKDAEGHVGGRREAEGIGRKSTGMCMRVQYIDVDEIKVGDLSTS